MAAIRPDRLADTIVQMMTEYRDAIDQDLEKISARVARQTKEKVKQNIGAAGIGGTGKYRQSIRSNKVESTLTASKSSLVYAASPYYRLTHLLEYGHATVNGGRTRAFPHWSEAEKQGVEQFEKELREAIEHGS